MRRYLLGLIFWLAGFGVYAQTVTVTASGIVDPNGNLYSNGTVSAFLVTPSGVIPKVGTAPVNPALGPFPTDSTASFSIQVTPNAIITPGGTQWQFTICGTSVNLGPQPKPLLQVCFNTALITVTSPGPQDITVQANAAAIILGPKTGGGGGGGSGVVGPGTVNTISKFVTPNQVGNSSATDDGVVATREPNGNNTAQSGNHDEWGVDAGGTIAGRLVCVTASRLVQTCALGATSGIVGVADKTVAAGGVVPICWAAKCNVTAATPTVTNDFLIASVTIAGEVDDAGATKPPNTQALPADSTVLAGQQVLTTLLSPDTINAFTSGSGTVQPCGPGVAYYPGPSVNTIINCIPNPSAPAAVPQLLNATPGGTPGWNLPGVPVSAQTGTNYTWLPTDRLKLITGSNALATTWTGPALISNFAAAFLNLNAGLITFTPASGQVNGGASQIIPQNWFGFHYTDNANTFMPVLPTLAAFPDCVDTTGNHLNFTLATGKLSCGNSGGGGGGAVNNLTGDGVVISNINSTGNVILTRANVQPNLALLGPISSGTSNLVQSASSVSATGVTQVLPYPQNITTGHLLLAVCESGNDGCIVTSSNNTWTANAAIGTGIPELRTFYVCNAVGGADTVTATLNGPAPIHIGLQIYEFSGNATVSCKDQDNAAAQTNGASFTFSTSGSVSQSTELVLGIVLSYGTPLVSAPSNINAGPGYSNLASQTSETAFSTRSVLRVTVNNNSTGLSGVQTANVIGDGSTTHWSAELLTFKLISTGSTPWQARSIVNADLPPHTPNPVFAQTFAVQTAAITDTAMVLTPAAAQMYRFNGTINCTTSSGSATATINLKWTDTSNTAQTFSATANCNALGASSIADITKNIRVKANTNITYGVTIANTPTYDLDMRLEQMN